MFYNKKDITWGRVHLGKNLLKDDLTITFPDDFDVHSWVDKYVADIKKSLNSNLKILNQNVNSRNFSEPSYTPIPGETYGVGMRFILDTPPGGLIGSEILDCMNLISGVQFFGAHGLSFFQIQHPQYFNRGSDVIAFDQIGSLWKDPGGNHRVLSIEKTLNRKWNIELASFNGGFQQGDIIFYVYKLKK